MEKCKFIYDHVFSLYGIDISLAIILVLDSIKKNNKKKTKTKTKTKEKTKNKKTTMVPYVT